MFLYCGKRLRFQLRASVLQYEITALRAVCPSMTAGCAAGAAGGCPGLSCRAGSLLCPRGCVPGMGLCRLPGSALSLPRELPRALRGDVWRKEPPVGLVLPQLLPGAGDHSFTAQQYVSEGTLQEQSQCSGFQFPVLGECRKDWRQKCKRGCHSSENFSSINCLF